MVYIVAYDLHKPNNTPPNRAAIESAVKALGSWAHIAESIWLVALSGVAISQTRDTLWKSLHEGDRLFVARLAGDWGSYNMDQDITRWLHEANFNA
jgi:hypothetical protein